ncbi:FkbM family methyltransferase [Amaricoccus tamworthensis]|uniref:FkbM family methyltransferase n=1 Tax=Amaricoccus tamworthensis TaxID=57002 RepID=UPI003C7A40C4
MIETKAYDFFGRGVIEYFGVLLPFEPQIITPAIQTAIAESRFEFEESKYIPEIIRAGDRILEIGAGIGFISTLLSRQTGVERIIAVEANPLLMDYIADVHDLNNVSGVERMNTVLTNSSEKQATFYLRDDFWMGSIFPEPNPYNSSVEVPTTRFSELLWDEDINVIVCDIEGGETILFQDADLSGVDRIYLEVHDHVTGLASVGRLFADLAAKGFIYDPRHSEGSVILFQKVGDEDIVRPFSG